MARNQNRWYSAEFKMDVIQKYLSGNSKVDPFCKEMGISKSTFYKWLEIYDNSFENNESLPTTAFQDITPVIKQDITPIIKTSKIKITLPNKMIIEFDSTELKNVMSELK